MITFSTLGFWDDYGFFSGVVQTLVYLLFALRLAGSNFEPIEVDSNLENDDRRVLRAALDRNAEDFRAESDEEEAARLVQSSTSASLASSSEAASSEEHPPKDQKLVEIVWKKKDFNFRPIVFTVSEHESRLIDVFELYKICWLEDLEALKL